MLPEREKTFYGRPSHSQYGLRWSKRAAQIRIEPGKTDLHAGPRDALNRPNGSYSMSYKILNQDVTNFQHRYQQLLYTKMHRKIRHSKETRDIPCLPPSHFFTRGVISSVLSGSEEPFRSLYITTAGVHRYCDMNTCKLSSSDSKHIICVPQKMR